MLKLKLTLIPLSIIFLSGCNGFPTILPQERCVIVLESDQGSYCRCHLYEWSKDHIGRISDSVDHEIKYCDKLIGFRPDTYGRVYTWWEEIRLWVNNFNKKPGEI